MSTDLEKIKSLARQRRYSDALAMCEALAQSAAIPVIDTLRARAHVLAMSGNYELALKDHEAILSDDAAKLRDYYLAADCALNSKRPERAAALFETLLQKEASEGGTWFRSGGYFLLAYAEMKLGEYEKALRHLVEAEAADPDCRMPVPEDLDTLWTTERLRSEIMKRRRAG